jgi:ABC-type lipoprotein export system ATPase subunit
VTHETDIAEYASRVIVVKDGVILSDELQEAKQAGAPS